MRFKRRGVAPAAPLFPIPCATPTARAGTLHAEITVCSIHPTFRGSRCGLRETLCSRSSQPILLARAKPGRGKQYGTGRPGGPQRLTQCLFRGCTPRSPKGVRGPQSPAHFGNFSAVKSSPPEATQTCVPRTLAANVPTAGPVCLQLACKGRARRKNKKYQIAKNRLGSPKRVAQSAFLR